MDPVYEYLKETFGLIVLAWIVIIAVVCGIIWKVAIKYANAKYKSDNLPCEKHEKNLETLSSSINGINVSLGKLETGLDGLSKMITMMASSSANSQLTQSHSPVSLTPRGKEIASALRFDDIISRNWDKIQRIVKGERNPYDIQMDFISNFITNAEELIDKESLDLIKRDAYLNGIPLIDYLRMFGVMSRDRYFSEHGIEVSEVDRT